MEVEIVTRPQNDRAGLLDLSEGLWALDTYAPETTERCLVFECGGQAFAAPIGSLRDVLVYASMTRVPGAPPWVLGLTNVRGTVVGVVDLARFLGLAEQGTGLTRTLICGVGPRLVGLAVSEAQHLISHAHGELIPAHGLSGRMSQFVEALLPAEGTLIPLLAVKQLINSDELTAR